MALISKLSPPVIENKLPAQYGNTLKIPFTLSRAVSRNQVNTMSMILRSVQANKDLAVIRASSFGPNANNIYEAQFDIANVELEIGQYYKIQLACCDANNLDDEGNAIVGFYSTVGVFKYTSYPEVTIENLKQGNMNFHCYSYTGKYSQDGKDPTEKVYSYRFDLYDDTNNIVASSGELLHNSSTDKPSARESTDTWTTRAALSPNLAYYLVYTVTTINGLIVPSSSYQIMDTETVDLNIYASLQGIFNQDNGYTSINLIGDKKTNKIINGQFILLRSSDEDQYQSWKEMTQFYLTNWSIATDLEICKDFSTAQGVIYKYAIQAYNNYGIYSNRLESNYVYSDFEDMFLYDGTRQLKIRFNPKVSSFKSTILESKLDTIGGQYPFFFRNGNVSYKEFPISGLISVLMDENNLFLTDLPEIDITTRTQTGQSQFNIAAPSRTQLTADNYRREREFKLEVLKWLNNGNVKLFRSPGEGNYIVRLMTVSLTPQDKLGRMLHQFTATAYEIADYSFENLKKYNLVVEDYIETRQLTFKQDVAHGSDRIDFPNAYICSVVGAPWTGFSYGLSNGDTNIGTTGPTGSWIFPSELLQDNPLIYITSQNWDIYGNGVTITYAYFIDGDYNEFSLIKSISIEDKVVQIIGDSEEIISQLEDVRKSTGAFYYIKVLGRQIVDCYIDTNGKYYEFEGGNEIEVSPLNIYYDGNQYYDGRTPHRPMLEEPDFIFSLNGDKVNLSGTILNDAGTSIKPEINGRFEAYTNIADVYEMYVGTGVLIDTMVYQEKIKTYVLEETDATVSSLKKRWENDPSDDNYKAYIDALKTALEEVTEGMSVNVV